MSEYVGILTAGGDSPGLNAAIRGVGKAGIGVYGMRIIGFRDGFRGLMQDRTIQLTERELSGILTIGGTILGTSRDKPNNMPVGGKTMDMTDVMVDIYKKHNLDVLICLGGGGTQKNAYLLMQKGLNIITLPKTIDNDVAMTDVTFGFDTALGIATEAIDRLHSTAHSHHRIVVVEVMGHNAGWLALGAGIAGGADVILIPEIPYNINYIAEAIKKRSKEDKRFSIVAVSEGAMSKKDAETQQKLKTMQDNTKNDRDRRKVKEQLTVVETRIGNKTMYLAEELQKLTGLEARITILGHLQRGGTPSAADRLLATRLGTACAELIHKGIFGVMISAHGDGTKTVPLEKVIGKCKTVPLNHSWIKTARDIGVCLGDESF